jgi:hypothetical protein
MAELNARIIAKASATAAEEPLAGDLEVAELAVNTADGKLFTKHTDGSIVTISGGGGGALSDLADVSPYTPELATYPTKASFNTQPLTGTWSAQSSALLFPPLADNGYDLSSVGSSTAPATIGISTDGIEFSYHAVLSWINYGSYINAGLGIDCQDIYDNNTSLYIDFGPQPSPVDGALPVYDSALQYYKIKKNSIANQSDFDYDREDSTYNYTFSATDTASPATGESTRWTGYGDAHIFFSTTDKDGLDAESDLYSLETADDAVIFVNGVEVFNGTLSTPQNKNASRISLQFATVQSWITNLVANDVVGIRSSRFDRKPLAKPLVDGQVLTWVETNSQWEPATPSDAVNSVNGQTGTVSLAIGNMTDVDTGADAASYASTAALTSIAWSASAGGGGFWQSNGIRINRGDGAGNKDTNDYSSLVGTEITIFTTDGSLTPDGSTTWNNVLVTGYLSDMDQYGGWYELEFAALYGAAPTGNYYFAAKSEPSPNTPTDGEILTWVDANGRWEPVDYISKTTLQAETAAATDFADFQARIAAL